ncbi:MAG TPA: hypothetical protein PK239_14920 [Chitinophagales bacterium]|nr:hypothetical protein [Chitinophagales bacterium]HRK28566.1 hypothetical protein [Chitinophagales bacterium]
MDKTANSSKKSAYTDAYLKPMNHHRSIKGISNVTAIDFGYHKLLPLMWR